MFERNWIENAIHTQASGKEQQFSEISTDSRSLKPGALFVAIKGDQFDGHDFIASAIENGAKGVLHTQDFSSNEVTSFQVKDTQKALTQIAASWRELFDIPVIMVAGSVGKTSTKDCLSHLLSTHYPEHLKTQMSQNGYLGIPLTLLNLRKNHTLAVIEIGIDEIGAMNSHLQTVKPNSGVVTAIAEEHLEKLKDLKTVATEELLSLQWIYQNQGKCLLNLDDTFISPLKSVMKDAYTYSLDHQEHSERMLSAQYLHENLGNPSLILNGMGFDQDNVNCPLPGQHQARNVLAAIALARIHGVPVSQIKQNLLSFKASQGRTQVKALGPYHLLADYYNASPASTKASLLLLSELCLDRNCAWICLGDMLELGVNEEKFHRSLSQNLAQLRYKNILLYGDRMKWLKDELQKNNITAHHFDSHEKLAQHLNSNIKKGDWILLKGSRGMKMEKTLEFLKT